MAESQGMFIAETGRPNGLPIIFFHGLPGSHKQGAFLDRHADKFNLKILSVDRPGYGFSPPVTGGMKGLVAALETELNRRGVDKFYLLGVSGGNPAALCSAAYFGARVLGIGSVCGMAPYHEAQETFSAFMRKGFKFLRWTPEGILRRSLDRMIEGFDPATRLGDLLKHVGARDAEILQRPEIRGVLLESIELARRQGSAGLVFDLKCMVAPWPMKWKDIRAPYFLWHGERDQILSPEMSRFMHAQVPHSRLRMFPEEGHYSLPIEQGEAILSDLLNLN